MALPATDAFTNTDGTVLTTHSASWTFQNGTFSIQGNAAAANTGAADSFASWNADTFGNDQYSQGVFLTPTAGEYAGVACRMAAGTVDTNYHYYSESGVSYFQKIVTGVYTQFGTTGGGFANNDAVKITANGTTITPFKNGVIDSGVGGAVTDSAIASGSAGIGGFGVATATDSRLDDWQGGSIATMTVTALAASSTSTSNATSYAGTAGTPAAGDLLIAVVVASDTTAAGTMTGTFVWSKLTSFTKNGGLDTIYVFWAYAATATSVTPTFACTADAATGCLISVYRLTALDNQTAPYIRQMKSAIASTANPSVTMDAAVLVGNGVIGFGGNGTNSSTQWTAPTRWTELHENTFATPSNSIETAYRASGETATTITWTNANVTAWGVMVIEFYVGGTVRPYPEIQDPLFTRNWAGYRM